MSFYGGSLASCRAAEGMMAAERPISSEELQAYVDDRLDSYRRQELEQYLDAQPELSDRLAAYRSQRDGLRQALAGYASAPIPPELNLSRLLENRLARKSFPFWRAAAVVALCLGLGAAAG